jgi:hypothetical protein
MPIPLNKIIFGENNPTTEIPGKILFFNGIPFFQIFLFLSTGVSDWRISFV